MPQGKFRNLGNVCLWILESGMRNTNQGIRNLTIDWNAESITLNPGYKGWIPESKTVLDCLAWSDVCTLIEF